MSGDRPLAMRLPACDAAVIAAFRRVLVREANVLARHPRLLWQQLHNRLQWESGAVHSLLEPVARRRSAPGARPWIRTRTRPPESDALLRTLDVSSGEVTALDVSPDAARLVTGDTDGICAVWDIESGRRIGQNRDHPAAVSSCCFSPDGLRVLSASRGRHVGSIHARGSAREGTCAIWDAEAGSVIGEFKCHRHWVTAVAFTPDGSSFLTGSQDRQCRLWSVDGGERATFAGHTDVVTACAVTADGAFLATGSQDGTAVVWEVGSGRKVTTLEGHTGAITACVFAPGTFHLATASRDATCRVWDAATAREIARFQEHTGAVTCCAFSPDGARLITGSEDRTSKIWDVDTDEFATLRGHAAGITACAVSSRGDRLVTGGRDGRCRIWQLDLSRMPSAGGSRDMSTEPVHSDSLVSCAFDRGGARVVLGSFDGTCCIRETATARERSRYRGRSVLQSCAFTPSGARVLSAAGPWRDLSLVVWDAERGEEVVGLKAPGVAHVAYAVADDGSRVVTADSDDVCRIWDGETGRQIDTLRDTGPITDCGLSSDGALLSGISPDYVGRVWCIASGQEVSTLEGPTGSVSAIAFAPDGSLVATSCHRTCSVWEVETGHKHAALEGHDDTVWVDGFSPDGEFLVTRSADGTCRVWDAASGRLSTVLWGHSGGVARSAFSPDGRLLVSVSRDATCRVWDVRKGECLAILPLAGPARAVAYHPATLLTACGYGGGSLCLSELVNVRLGPLFVTARGGSGYRWIRCPACLCSHALEDDWLGRVIYCPTATCCALLKVNRFLARDCSRRSGSGVRQECRP